MFSFLQKKAREKMFVKKFHWKKGPAVDTDIQFRAFLTSFHHHTGVTRSHIDNSPNVYDFEAT